MNNDADRPQYEELKELFEALRLNKHRRGQIEFLIEEPTSVSKGVVRVVEFPGYDRHGDPYDPTLLVEDTPERVLRDLCHQLGFYAEEV